MSSLSILNKDIFSQSSSIRMRLLVSFIVGSMVALSMPPYALWPALFIGISLLYLLISNCACVKRAFFIGFIFAFGFFLFSLSWIGNALLVEGSPYKLFYPLAIAALPALLSFFIAIPCSLSVKFSELKSISGYLLFCCLLSSFEWLRGHIFTGFPWNLFAYSWAKNLQMIQIGSIGGAYILSLVTILAACLPGYLITVRASKKISSIYMASAVIILGLIFIYGHVRMGNMIMSERNELQIKIVQPNIAQKDKWNPDKTTDNLNKLFELSLSQKDDKNLPTLIIWPETAVTGYLLNETGVRTALESVLSSYDSPVYLLTGVMRAQKNEKDEKKYYNSLVLFDNRVNILSYYDKSHLVPFGEYIPFQDWIPLSPVVNFSGFEKGNGRTSIELISTPGSASLKFSPLICYEIIFPGAAQDNDNRADFIVNVTNDAWYGDSAGPRQHLVMAQYRAIEEGIAVMRAANTGISAIIDPLGQITQKQELMSSAVLTQLLPGKLKPTIYGKYKDLLFFICLIGLLILSTTLRPNLESK